eukprot:gene6639-biopygen8443
MTRLGSSSTGQLGPAAAEAALEARRAIYRNNLWARPHHSAAAATATAVTLVAAATGGSSSSSRSGVRVSETSLEQWIERELQALLLEQDVTVICAFVKGVVNSFGVAVPAVGNLDQQQQQQQCGAAGTQGLRLGAAAAAAAAQVANALTRQHASSSRDGSSSSGGSSSSSRPPPTISSAVAALEGFLFEVAQHFWHELCCYATSGLSVAAWDRVAQYSAQQQQQQQPPDDGGCLMMSGRSAGSVGFMRGSDESIAAAAAAAVAGGGADQGTCSGSSHGGSRTATAAARQRPLRWDQHAVTVPFETPVLLLQDDHRLQTRQQRHDEQQQEQQQLEQLQRSQQQCDAPSAVAVAAAGSVVEQQQQQQQQQPPQQPGCHHMLVQSPVGGDHVLKVRHSSSTSGKPEHSSSRGSGHKRERSPCNGTHYIAAAAVSCSTRAHLSKVGDGSSNGSSGNSSWDGDRSAWRRRGAAMQQPRVYAAFKWRQQHLQARFTRAAAAPWKQHHRQQHVEPAASAVEDRWQME